MKPERASKQRPVSYKFAGPPVPFDMKTLSSKREVFQEMSTSDYLCESREDAWVWDRIGDAYWREARPEAARRAWERARRLKPGNSQVRDKLTAINTGRDPLALSA